MKILAVGLPVDMAYDIAEGKRNTFPVSEKPLRLGNIVIFALAGGDFQRPGLATAAEAILESARWNGRRWVCKVRGAQPLVPHLPILVADKVHETDIPDILIERYPDSRNIKRWLK